MDSQADYTLFHPRWYRRRVSVWWWLQKGSNAFFVLRELTSLAVAYFAIVSLWKIRSFASGPEAYANFLARMRSPWFVVLNSLALLAVVFHAVTWFNLAPKAMTVRVGGKRVPDGVIQAMNYLAWLAVSAGVVWVALRG